MAALSALSALDALLPKLNETSGGSRARNCADVSALLSEAIATGLPFLEANALPEITFPRFRSACDAALERGNIATSIDSDGDLRAILEEHFAGVETHTSRSRPSDKTWSAMSSPIHEAGHAVIGRALSLICGQATVESDEDSAGHSRRSLDRLRQMMASKS